MRFKLYRQFGSLNSAPVFGAAEQGLKNIGHTIVNSGEDIPVIWSVLWNGRMQGNRDIFEKCIKEKRPIIVLEVGGISRGETWKVALNGINNEAVWGEYDYDNLKRATKLGLNLKSWRSNGDNILICGQHNKSYQWRNMPSIDQWLCNTIEEIRQHTDRPIIFRPHPRCPVRLGQHKFKNVTLQTPIKLMHTYDDFDMGFKNIWATVSWSSNPGIHSIIEGIPAYTGPASLAYDVSIKEISQIENPSMPERDKWLSRYSFTEFTIQEIADGYPFENLLKQLD